MVGWRRQGWRLFGWGGAAFLLLLPIIINAPWSTSDFVFMGLLLSSVGLAFELAVLKGAGAYRMGAGVALAAAFFLAWANLAVGMIGSEDNPFNLLFGGVLGIALLGAIVARFEPAGMARAMAAAAIAQLAVGAVGFSNDARGGIWSMALAGLWLLAAALFRHAAAKSRLVDPSGP